MQPEIIEVIGGTCIGEFFHIDRSIKNVQASIFQRSCELEGYTEADAPFYFGTIGGQGYVLSAKHLGL